MHIIGSIIQYENLIGVLYTIKLQNEIHTMIQEVMNTNSNEINMKIV